jgi:hypothetical protein
MKLIKRVETADNSTYWHVDMFHETSIGIFEAFGMIP